MPLPKRGEKETKEEFMARCMSDDKVKEEFPNQQQRVAVCMSNAGYSAIEAADVAYNHETYGFTEEINEDNFYVPAEAEYEDFGEETEEWDVSEAKPGLWENIRKKKEREGKNYKPAKRGDKDRPDPEAWKKAQSASCPAATQDIELNTKNRNETIENHMYGPLNPDEPGDYWQKIANMWDTTEEAAKQSLCGNCVAFDISQRMNECMPGEVSDESGRLGYCWMHHFKCHSARTCETWAKGGPITSNEMSEKWNEKAQALEYQGKKVKLNKPFRTPKGPKKFAVYTKNDKGNVVIVRFGDPDMKIKKNIPERRKSFRARHNCDNPGPRWKARYWSCQWSWR